MSIDENWTFKELVDNLKALKEEYDTWLALFLSFPNNAKIINKYRRYVRDKFYSLKLKEWQIDVCWEYMNDYRLYIDIVRIIKRIEKNISK